MLTNAFERLLSLSVGGFGYFQLIEHKM